MYLHVAWAAEEIQDYWQALEWYKKVATAERSLFIGVRTSAMDEESRYTDKKIKEMQRKRYPTVYGKLCSLSRSRVHRACPASCAF